ncbi:hypothetical protein FOL47_001748 [Perkinsus chesapeaki]|uniref:Pyruvate kinase n=1 Tax=Perkinsus chesapeaki TaxID=330153 RepID=A0A7J6KT95_PERCH|nr:hypothetical protein FOL47_001748 [Perkinsus chesapeaki]
MIENPRPTRAEVSDVADAVLDGTDGVMLSGEAANGKFPVNAISIQRRICENAEAVIDYDSLYLRIREAVMNKHPEGLSVSESICANAVGLASEVNASLILAFSQTGSTSRLLAKYRPRQQILCITDNKHTVAHTAVARGVLPFEVESLKDTEAVMARALEYAKQVGLVKVGDKVVAVHGVKENTAGATNMTEVIYVE